MHEKPGDIENVEIMFIFHVYIITFICGKQRWDWVRSGDLSTIRSVSTNITVATTKLGIWKIIFLKKMKRFGDPEKLD